MVLVDEKERTDVHRLIKRIHLLAAVVVLVGVVDKPVVVAVRQVYRQDGYVPEFDVQVWVMRRRRIGVEQDDRAREVPIGDATYRHTARRVLLRHNGACRKAREVDDEPRRRALSRFSGESFSLAVVLIIAIVMVPVGVAVPFVLRVATVSIAAAPVPFVAVGVIARIALVLPAGSTAVATIFTLAVLATIAAVRPAQPLTREVRKLRRGHAVSGPIAMQETGRYQQKRDENSDEHRCEEPFKQATTEGHKATSVLLRIKFADRPKRGGLMSAGR